MKTMKPRPDHSEARHATAPGRNATERLLRFRRLIGEGHYPNCARLAREFGVSVKTLKRDVQWMRDHWKLPIVFDASKNGYYFSRPVDPVPAVPGLSEAEVFALLAARTVTGQYRGTPFQQPLERAFERLVGRLDHETRYSLCAWSRAVSFRPVAPERLDLARFESVARAVRDQHALRFPYRKPGDRLARPRHVHPYHLTCRDHRWYLVAWDVEQRDYRSFVLGRITGAPEVGERFERRVDFDLERQWRGSFTIMRGAGDYRIEIAFDAWATDIMRGRTWHASQRIIESPGGGSRLCLRLSGLEEVERWTLSWGTHATVIRPRELRDRVKRLVQELGERYTDGATQE